MIALPPKQAKFFSPDSYGCTMFPTQLPRSLQILRRDALTGTPLGSRLGFFEEIGARHPSIHRSILALDPHSALLFVLGQGVESARASDWSAFFRMAATFVCEVRTLSVWPVHMSSPE